MNDEIKKKAEEHAPIYGAYSREGGFLTIMGRWLMNFLKVGTYKLGYLLVVEALSKAGMACLAWPAANMMMLWGIHKADSAMKIDDWPYSLVLVIEAIFIGMWCFKGTTKKLLDIAGQALLEWAKRK